MDEYLNNIINAEIKILLDVINKSYPDKFTESDITDILRKIKLTPTYINTAKNEIDKLYKSTLQKKKYFNTGKYNVECDVKLENRCVARIWANGFILKKNNEIINYGKQCSRAKTDNSNYCSSHIDNNPHDDYNRYPPPKSVIENFKKYSNM